MAKYLDDVFRQALDDCVARILECGDIVAVVLIGSVARNVPTEASDIDLLVLAESALERPRCHPLVHLQILTKAEFIRRLRSGDDFTAWCIRLGVPLRSEIQWQEIRNCPEAEMWPRWERKVRHAARRLVLATDLQKTGDLSSASEEMLYAVAHTARALLLKNQVFPLSRPEMAAQLLEIGYPHLARVLENLLADDQQVRALERARRYVKRLLVTLDRDTYQGYAAERRAAARERRRRRTATG